MEEATLNTPAQEIQSLFNDLRFTEDRIIEYVSDEYVKFISKKEALEICQLIVDDFNEMIDLPTHIFNACFDYFKNLKFQTKS